MYNLSSQIKVVCQRNGKKRKVHVCAVNLSQTPNTPKEILQVPLRLRSEITQVICEQYYVYMCTSIA